MSIACPMKGKTPNNCLFKGICWVVNLREDYHEQMNCVMNKMHKAQHHFLGVLLSEGCVRGGLHKIDSQKPPILVQSDKCSKPDLTRTIRITTRVASYVSLRRLLRYFCDRAVIFMNCQGVCDKSTFCDLEF